MTASETLASTPANSSTFGTPSTPRHDGDDGRRLYHTRSTRQNARQMTPTAESTVSAGNSARSRSQHHARIVASTPAAKRNRVTSSTMSRTRPDSPSSSIHSTPEIGHSHALDQAPMDRLNHDTVDQAALDYDDAKRSKLGSSARQSQYMLPTPASLPRKKKVSQPAVNAAARILFPTRAEATEEDVAATIGRTRKHHKHVGFSTGDETEEGQSQIQIHVDSKDTIPELDPREDNPFIDQEDQVTVAAPAAKSRSKRRRVTKVTTDPHIKEIYERTDGMVYFFRGKKFFRELPEETTSPSSEEEEAFAPEHNGQPKFADIKANYAYDDNEAGPRRPITRASIKPRLLFPPRPKAQDSAKSSATTATAGADTDEEALTEIEDNTIISSKISKPQTPIKSRGGVASSYAGPNTPPSTVARPTRASRRKAEEEDHTAPATPGSPTSSARGTGILPPTLKAAGPDAVHTRSTKRQSTGSPFAGWARTKAGVSRSGSRSATTAGCDEV